MSPIHHASHTCIMHERPPPLSSRSLPPLYLRFTFHRSFPPASPLAYASANFPSSFRVDACVRFPRSHSRTPALIRYLLRACVPPSGTRNFSSFFLSFSFFLPRSSVLERSRRIIAPRVSFRIPLGREVPNFSPPSIARRVVDSMVRNKRYRHRQLPRTKYTLNVLRASLFFLPVALLRLALRPIRSLALRNRLRPDYRGK